MVHGNVPHRQGTHTYCRVTVLWVVRVGVRRASTDRRSIGHGIVRDIKEREVESLMLSLW